MIPGRSDRGASVWWPVWCAGSFALIDQALGRHPREQISFEEARCLGRSVVSPKGVTVLGDRTVTLAHIQAFLRPVILRFLGGADTGLSGRAAPGLTRAAWERLRLRFEHWNDGQRYLEAVYRTASGKQDLSDPEIVAGFEPPALEPLTLAHLLGLGAMPAADSKAGDDANPAEEILEDAAGRIQHMIVRDRALFPGNSSQIYFNGYNTDRRLSLHNLSEANWMYELGRMLTSGYAEDPARRHDGGRSDPDGELRRVQEVRGRHQ